MRNFHTHVAASSGQIYITAKLKAAFCPTAINFTHCTRVVFYTKRPVEQVYRPIFAMAGVLGLEPRSTVLETVALPLNYTPMERKTRFELATPSLARRCSTSELFPHLATRMGLEPTTSAVTGRHSNQLNHRAIVSRLTDIDNTIIAYFWQAFFTKSSKKFFNIPFV